MAENDEIEALDALDIQKMFDLTDRQSRFVEEYQKDLNATRAAKRAGYSEKTAGQIGCALLKNVNVTKALEHSRQIWADNNGITKDAILQELAALGFASMGTFLNVGDSGDVTVDLTSATGDELKALHSVEITTMINAGEHNTTETVKRHIKLHDKRAALEAIGKHLGMFTDKLDIDLKAAAVPISFGVNPAKGKVRVQKD